MENFNPEGNENCNDQVSGSSSISEVPSLSLPHSPSSLCNNYQAILSTSRDSAQVNRISSVQGFQPTVCQSSSDLSQNILQIGTLLTLASYPEKQINHQIFENFNPESDDTYNCDKSNNSYVHEVPSRSRNPSQHNGDKLNNSYVFEDPSRSRNPSQQNGDNSNNSYVHEVPSRSRNPSQEKSCSPSLNKSLYFTPTSKEPAIVIESPYSGQEYSQNINSPIVDTSQKNSQIYTPLTPDPSPENQLKYSHQHSGISDCPEYFAPSKVCTLVINSSDINDDPNLSHVPVNQNILIKSHLKRKLSNDMLHNGTNEPQPSSSTVTYTSTSCKRNLDSIESKKEASILYKGLEPVDPHADILRYKGLEPRKKKYKCHDTRPLPLYAQISPLTSEKEAFRGWLNARNAELHRRDKDEKMEEQDKKMEEKDKKMEEKDKKMEEKDKKMEEKDKKIKEQDEKIKEQDEKMDELNEKMEELNENCSLKSIENVKLKEEIVNVKEKHNNLNKEYNNVKIENNKLKEEVTSLKEENNNLKKGSNQQTRNSYDITKILSEKIDLKEENDSLKEENNILKKECKKQKVEINQKNEELEKKNNEISNLEATACKNEYEKLKIQCENTEMMKDLDNCKQQLKSSRQQNKLLKKNNKTFQNLLNQKKE